MLLAAAPALSSPGAGKRRLVAAAPPSDEETEAFLSFFPVDESSDSHSLEYSRPGLGRREKVSPGSLFIPRS